MVSSVNSVSADKVFQPLTSEMVNSPHKTQGVYAKPQSDTVEISKEKSQKKPKKNRFWRGLGKLILAAVVVGGALVGANKAGWLKSEKLAVSKLKQAAQWTEKKALSAWKSLTGLFKSKKVSEVSDEAEKIVKESTEEVVK